MQKPFYFHLIATGAVQLPAEPHPHDLYHSFFVTLSAAFAQSLSHPLDLERMLAGLAYEAVNRGREALPVAVILQGLKKEMQSAGIGGLSTEDVANWLVGTSGAAAIFRRARRLFSPVRH